MLQFCCCVFNISMQCHFYCLLTEWTQNVLLFWLSVWVEKMSLGVFWPTWTLSQLAGKELNFSRDNPCLYTLDVVHWSLCRAQYTLHGNRASHGAKHQNTIQTKGRLMARIIATQRFVPICFFLTQQISIRYWTFVKSLTHSCEQQLGFSSSLSVQLQFTLSLKHHWAAKWYSTQSHR